MRLYLAEAIKSLRPTSEFSYINEDYSSINWVILESDAPTESEIEAEIERIKAQEITENEDRKIAKAALLERLGITEEEAKLLLA